MKNGSPTNAELRAQAEWVAACGEPTRLLILRALAAGEKIVTEVAKVVKTEVVNVSHHLKIMREVGVVKCDRDGRFMRYSLLGATATPVELLLTHESGMSVVIPLN